MTAGFCSRAQPRASTDKPPSALRQPLCELLTSDRARAGEARQPQVQGPLRTEAYKIPWQLQLKQQWRDDRRLRIAAWSSCLACTAVLVLWQVPLRNAPSALAVGEQRVGSLFAELRAARPGPSPLVAEPSRQPSGMSAQAASQPEPHARADALPRHTELSPQRRLQRADLWLHLETARGAREARSLLESALQELPGSAHGQAALAETCLRLQDPTCARAAIAEALRIRPRRGGYRALAQRIAAAFEAQ